MSESDEFAKRVAELRANYVTSLPERLSIALRVLGGELSSEGDLHEAHRVLHSIAGSAATFGLPGLGSASRDAEILVRHSLEGGEPPPGSWREAGRALVQEALSANIAIVQPEGPA